MTGNYQRRRPVSLVDVLLYEAAQDEAALEAREKEQATMTIHSTVRCVVCGAMVRPLVDSTMCLWCGKDICRTCNEADPEHGCMGVDEWPEWAEKLDVGASSNGDE